MFGKKHYIRSCIIIILIICLLLCLYQKYNNMVDISVLEYGELEEIVSTTGVVVKDEAVVCSNSVGEVKFYYNEGTKVSKGSYLADVSTANSTQMINDEIKLIDDAINKLNSNEEPIISIDSNESSDKNKYASYDLRGLQSLKAQLENGVKNNKIPYFSPKSGYVTYEFDGLEGVLNYNNVYDIMPTRLAELEQTNFNTYGIVNVNAGDNLVKVINNFEYYIVCLVNNSDANTYKEKSYIKVRFDDNPNIIYGWINKINYGADQSLLVISFDDFFYEIYNKRMINLSLITNVYQGIKLDKAAVTEQNGIKGVYIKDISNIIKFFPIEIIGENDSEYIVSQGKIIADGERGIITINNTNYSTVKAFDKVVLDIDKVYEGQIVD